MPRINNVSPRTCMGTPLMDKQSDPKEFTSRVTTRKFDVELYEKTGELKYLEEGTDVPAPNAIKNTDLMRAELTTIEQFQTIGSYSQVAKKYGISKSAAHAHMRHLRAKAAREEKEEKDMFDPASNPEKIQKDEELPVIEINNPVNLLIESYTHNEHKVEELEAHVAELEKQWPKSNPTIEDKWSEVEGIISDIHAMYIDQAEREYRERLASLYFGKSAC